MAELFKSDAELEAIIRAKGEVKGFANNNKKGGETVGARYYVCFINEGYYFLFENVSGEGEVFKGTFSFTMENLRIEREKNKGEGEEGGESGGANGFKVELRPGEKRVRRLVRVDNTQKSKYKLSFSYCFIVDE